MTGLKHVTLHAARSKAFPDGSARHGYDLVLPLDAAHRIDTALWKEKRALCVAHRFWGDEARSRGLLVHRAGGAHGATWLIDEDPDSDSDDRVGLGFGDHTFAVGDYVTLRDDDGEAWTFRVVAVSNA